MRDRSGRVSLREMFRDEMKVNEREREASVYYFNHQFIKIIIFFFSSHEQCTSIFRCAL